MTSERMMHISKADYLDLLISLGWSDEEAKRYICWIFA